jgi:hypothetical protein
MDLEIIDLLLKDQVIDKLIWKHNISEVELRQVFNNQPNIRIYRKRENQRGTSLCCLRKNGCRKISFDILYNEEKQKGLNCYSKRYDR